MTRTELLSSTVTRDGPTTIGGSDAGRTVVWLHGEHDLSTVSALQKTLAQAILLDDADLVVDMSGVAFMDASTIGVICRARESLQRHSRAMAVRSPSNAARLVLRACDLLELVDRRDDIPQATSRALALESWVAVPATVSTPTRSAL